MQLSKLLIRSHRLLKTKVLHGHKSSIGFNSSRILPSFAYQINRNYASGNEIDSNPYFEKYKDKIKHMQSTNPEEYTEKMQELAKRLNPETHKKKPSETNEGSSGPVSVAPPSDKVKAGVGMTRPKSLDAIMKVELLRDKTAEEITTIWNQYHSNKDCVFTVLKAHEFNTLMDKSRECPVFMFPIRRADGIEMMLAQFDRHDIYFTPLSMFQLLHADSPPCLTLNHYTELMDDKGIVLMKGEYDDKVLTSPSALSLVQQMGMFYGQNARLYQLVHRLNHEPEKFDHNELIEIFKTLPQYDMQ